MILLRKFKNNMLKHFNKRKIVVYKHYNYMDDLERVEVYYYYENFNYNVKKFKENYLHEWERYLNMTKYKLGLEKGVWVEVFEGGFDLDDMVRVKKEFYTK